MKEFDRHGSGENHCSLIIMIKSNGYFVSQVVPVKLCGLQVVPGQAGRGSFQEVNNYNSRNAYSLFP